MELLWWADADEAMNRLERDPASAQLLVAVRRVLGSLEINPFDPRIASRQFVTEEFHHVRATPVRQGDWWVLWQLGPGEEALTILLIAEIAL